MCYNICTVRKQEQNMQYAIVNFTTKQSDFYATFEDASNACTNYNVQPGHVVAIVDLQENAVEQL
jgi:hypothetical protein